ncbi:MAG: histidinol-phosphatase HisJ family protein [Syntrophomonas sp.]
MLVDYHIHAAAHGEYEYSLEWLERFILNARRRGINEIGLCEHDEFLSRVNLDVVKMAQAKHKDVRIRLGMEADFIPGQDKQIRQKITANDYDYIIGSIHFINNWGFDHPDYKDRFDYYDIDDVYAAYFNLVEEMVRSGWFDVVGHLDLVKIWGHRPKTRSIISYVEPVLNAIKESGMVVEINSAGLRKPVKEIYPAAEIVRMMFNLNIPVTLSSDAHHPDQVGEDFSKIIELITRAGYRSIIQFDQHRKTVVSV